MKKIFLLCLLFLVFSSNIRILQATLPNNISLNKVPPLKANITSLAKSKNESSPNASLVSVRSNASSVKADPAAPADDSITSSSPTPPLSQSDEKIIGGVFGGLGIVGLLAGTGAIIHHFHKKNHQQRGQNRKRQLNISSPTAFTHSTNPEYQPQSSRNGRNDRQQQSSYTDSSSGSDESSDHESGSSHSSQQGHYRPVPKLRNIGLTSNPFSSKYQPPSDRSNSKIATGSSGSHHSSQQSSDDSPPNFTPPPPVTSARRRNIPQKPSNHGPQGLQTISSLLTVRAYPGGEHRPQVQFHHSGTHQNRNHDHQHNEDQELNTSQKEMPPVILSPRGSVIISIRNQQFQEHNPSVQMRSLKSQHSGNQDHSPTQSSHQTQFESSQEYFHQSFGLGAFRIHFHNRTKGVEYMHPESVNQGYRVWGDSSQFIQRYDQQDQGWKIIGLVNQPIRKQIQHQRQRDHYQRHKGGNKPWKRNFLKI